MSGDRRYDVVVVGASVAGMAAVLALRGAGLRIAVIDSVTQFGERKLTWGHDLEPNALLALEFLGLLDEVIALGVVHHHWFAHRAGGELLSRWDYSILKHTHPYAVQVRAHSIRTLMRDKTALAPGVDMLIPAEFLAMTSDRNEHRVKIRLAGEEIVLRTRLVIGADGPNSRVRAAAGIDAQIRPYHQGWADTIVARDESELNEGYIAFGRGEYLGICPTRPGELVMFHLSRARDANAYRAQFGGIEQLREAYVRLAPVLQNCIRNLSSWDQLTYAPVFRVRANRWTADGVALVGDAALSVHSITSQGLCLALEGGVSLATIIRRCFERRVFSAQALAPYESWRRPQAEAVQELGDLCSWAFLSANPLISYLKERMLRRMQTDRQLQHYVLASFCGLHWLVPRRLGLWDGVAAAGLLPVSRGKLSLIERERYVPV